MVSVNAQAHLSMRADSPEPSLLSHMHRTGPSYCIFYQSILRLEVTCMQSCHSLHCSRKCTNGCIYIWHILLVKAQTSLSMRSVSPEPSLLSHMHINGRTYSIFFQPMLRLEVACMQSCQSLHCSRTCAKLAYIHDIFYQSMLRRALCMCAVPSELSLLSHMQIKGVHMTYSFREFSDQS